MRTDYPIIGLVLAHSRGILQEIREDPHDITSRIRDIEKEYFICYNNEKEAYEVHSTAQPLGDTYCFTIPYEELDSRTLEYCRQTNVANRGDEIIAEIDYQNEVIKKAKNRAAKSMMNDIATDMADIVEHGLAQDELREGYSKTHVMSTGWEDEE